MNTRKTKIHFILLLIFSTGCEYNTLEEPIDCTASDLALEVISKQNASCGQTNGSAEVAATGGSGANTYSITQGTFQSSPLFQNLAAGQYLIEVKDKSCSSTVSVDILNAGDLNISVAATEAGCDANAGSISITTSGGQAPVQLSLNGGAFGSTTSFQNLSHGNYTIVAKDASACEVAQTVNLNSGVGFSASVSTIIQTNCAISGCHVAGQQSPNLSSFANIQSNAAGIKSRTASRSMPQGGTLTQAQINTIACWVDDGAQNN
ncbi:MAG: hypothetical protein WKF87_14050 [Chryseolinea sp.]